MKRALTPLLLDKEVLFKRGLLLYGEVEEQLFIPAPHFLQQLQQPLGDKEPFLCLCKPLANDDEGNRYLSHSSATEALQSAAPGQI